MRQQTKSSLARLLLVAKNSLPALAAFSFAILLFGCSANSQPSNSQQQLQTPLAKSSAVPVIDQAPVLEAQAQQLRHKQVTIGATVLKTLPDDTRGIRHQRFLIALDNGTTVLIAHNIDIAPHIPIQKGDYLVICGEYIWNEKGGVIHWTHHSDNPYHPGGYIDFAGKRYQ